MAALYGGIKLSFPNLSSGMIFLLFNFIEETKLFLISLLSQIVGIILGGLVYKTLVCENDKLDNKELEVHENEANINF